MWRCITFGGYLSKVDNIIINQPCCTRDGITYNFPDCWLCKVQQEAIENDPEWRYEEYGDAPLHDMYPLELDYTWEHSDEYDPEDFDDIDDE